MASLKTGSVNIENKLFELPERKDDKCAIGIGTEGIGDNPLPMKVDGIQINEDVSSLIFLHACARPAGNQKSYFSIFNTFDSSDLLGWYEVEYEDGYTPDAADVYYYLKSSVGVEMSESEFLKLTREIEKWYKKITK